MKSTDSNRSAVTGRTRNVVIFLQKTILLLARHWFVLANLLAGIILGAGFLAPALMAAEQPEAGQSVYRFLASHNHQLPQRSYFLFGQAGGIRTYSTEQLIAWGADPYNMQAFLGNPDIGFKMALNHRMTAIFIAILLGGLGWGLAHGRPRLSFVWLLLMALPLLLDGYSHMMSENSGEGFRAGNDWAVRLTGDIFPAEFYTGNTIGSLNWWLRTLTGLIFGLGLVWFLYTYFDNRFLAMRARLEPRLRRIGAIK
jgi:uncharacterized membrane protein